MLGADNQRRDMLTCMLVCCWVHDNCTHNTLYLVWICCLTRLQSCAAIRLFTSDSFVGCLTASLASEFVVKMRPQSTGMIYTFDLTSLDLTSFVIDNSRLRSQCTFADAYHPNYIENIRHDNFDLLNRVDDVCCDILRNFVFIAFSWSRIQLRPNHRSLFVACCFVEWMHSCFDLCLRRWKVIK